MYRIRKQLIKSLSQTITEGVNELGEKYQAVQILPELQQDYQTQLRPEIISVRIYQTEKDCYLETTIDENREKGFDPEYKNPEISGEEYSMVNFRIHRESLALISLDGETSFSPADPVVENATNFLCDMDDYSLSICTFLFTDAATKEISEKHEMEHKYNNSNEPVEYTPGEITISGMSLKDLDGYNSEEDPEFPGTPLIAIVIGELGTNILLSQNDEHVGSDKTEFTGKLPTFIQMESDEWDEKRFTTFSIPNNQIKNIRVKSTEAPYIEYNLPRQYEYCIELTSGGKLIITGKFGEGSKDFSLSPEYWYYRLKIEVKEG